MSESEQQETSGVGKTFLSSGEVVERLGVSKSTLYAYVSRGLIRSEPDPESPRMRRYRADDVERLLARQRMRSDPEQAASTVLTWGSPVMESSVSMIADGHLYYGEHAAVELARTHTFEEVIGLLWHMDSGGQISAGDAAIRDEVLRQSDILTRSLDPLARVQSLLPMLEQREPASYDFRPATIRRIGAGIFQLFTAALVGTEGHSGIARTLQAHWTPGEPGVERLINAALVLSADHELNISTFTVRCVASAGAPLHSAIAAGLSAIRGNKHGGAACQAGVLINEIDTPQAAYSVLRKRVERGAPLAGFGHRLYPDGDPRGAALLAFIREQLPDSPANELADAVCAAAFDLQGTRPNIDLGLAVLSRALGQPEGTALSLMAFGRIAGWVAHAQEEYARDQLIRPRARYGEQGADGHSSSPD